MAIRLRNTKSITSYLIKLSKRIENALILELEYLVAELENHAKSNAGYKDQTSNLKGSIGGVVLKDGKKIAVRGFESFGSDGNQTGIEFINSLIVVAGMEYATYVENYHGLNVLKKSELKMNRELPIVLRALKEKINLLS